MALAGIAVFCCLWYLSHHGFSEQWRKVVIAEAEKRGVHLTLDCLTLDLSQGLVARNIEIRTSKEQGRAMAFINEVILDINYSNIVHGEPFLNALELRNAKLSLPMDEDTEHGKHIEISNLNARVLLPAHHLTVEHATAVIHGVKTTLSAHFVNPEQFVWPHEPAGSPSQSPLFLGKLMDALEGLQISGKQPALELRLSGDLAKPSDLSAEAVFRADRFTINKSCRIESLHVGLALGEGRVRIYQCEARDEHGTLNATGSYDIASEKADLQLRSTLDLFSVIRAVLPNSPVKEIAWSQPPLLEMSGSANLNEPAAPEFELFGHISTGQFTFKSLKFQSAGTDFSWKSDGSWYVHNAHIQHEQGDCAFNAMQLPGDFRFHLASRIPPAIFYPLLPNELRPRLAEWEFCVPPVVEIEGHGTACEPSALDITGKIQMGATRARGTVIKKAACDLAFKANVLTCQNIRFEREEGMGSGTVVYDFNTDELQFQNVKTSLNPVEVVRIFDRDLAQQLTPYRFKVRPALVVNGKVGCARDSWQRNNLRIEVEGAHGMDYTFLKKELSASKISGMVTILVDRLKLDGLEAEIWGGHLHGKADISLRKAAGDYTAEITTDEIDFPSLTKLYFGFDTSKGKLNGSFVFSGLHDSVRAIAGKGELHVSDGNVFDIPIFGPFSGILNEVLPGLGYNEARKGDCTFEMRDGMVNTKDLVVQGRGFSILGKGNLNLVDDKMDLTARINAQGLAGKFLDPMSHLLEYVSEGSLSKPIWRPKRLPKMSTITNLPKTIFGPRSQPSSSPSPSPSAAP